MWEEYKILLKKNKMDKLAQDKKDNDEYIKDLEKVYVPYILKTMKQDIKNGKNDFWFFNDYEMQKDNIYIFENILNFKHHIKKGEKYYIKYTKHNVNLLEEYLKEYKIKE